MVDHCSSRPMTTSEEMYFPDNVSIGSNSSSITIEDDFMETCPGQIQREKKYVSITPTKKDEKFDAWSVWVSVQGNFGITRWGTDLEYKKL